MEKPLAIGDCPPAEPAKGGMVETVKMRYRLGIIFWLCIGIYVALAGYQLGLGHLNQPGPGFIFFLAALLLVILSVIDLMGTFIPEPESHPEKKDEPIRFGIRWPKVLLVLMGLLAYNFAFSFLGFLFSTLLLMTFLFKAVEPMKWWISILGSGITVLVSYGVFQLWLKVPFPSGILGF